MDYLIVIAAFAAGLGLGNALGDKETLQDCATKNQARLVGGATIECNVKKAAP